MIANVVFKLTFKTLNLDLMTSLYLDLTCVSIGDLPPYRTVAMVLGVYTLPTLGLFCKLMI